jgi:hypothetical protein
VRNAALLGCTSLQVVLSLCFVLLLLLLLMS